VRALDPGGPAGALKPTPPARADVLRCEGLHAERGLSERVRRGALGGEAQDQRATPTHQALCDGEPLGAEASVGVEYDGVQRLAERAAQTTRWAEPARPQHPRDRQL
jgi:hypothetical protein